VAELADGLLSKGQIAESAAEMRYESFFFLNDSILLTDILEPNIKNTEIVINFSNFGNKISKKSLHFFSFSVFLFFL
jgi:hypothetical protein